MLDFSVFVVGNSFFIFTQKRGLIHSLAKGLVFTTQQNTWIDLLLGIVDATKAHNGVQDTSNKWVRSFPLKYMCQAKPSQWLHFIRFEFMWLLSVNMKGILKAWWNKSPKFFVPKMFCFASKLNMVKQKFYSWNKEEFCSILEDKLANEASLEQVAKAILKDDFTNELLILKKQLLSLQELSQANEEIFQKLNSRDKWIHEGYRNSSYFHAITMAKRQVNKLSYVIDRRIDWKGQKTSQRKL